MKNTILILMSLSLAPIFGQNSKVLNLTLDEAFEIGLKNRFDTQANKLDVEMAENASQKSKKEWLPTISASADVKYNTQLQTMVFDGFGATGANKVTMGTKNNTFFTLDLNQPIYKPGLNTDIKIAEVNAMLVSEKNKEKDITVKQRIAEAYLNVLLKSVLLQNAKDVELRSTKYYTIAQSKFDLGVLLEDDLLKAQLDFENAKISCIEANNNYNMALIQLRFQLNIEQDFDLLLTDSIETFTNKVNGERLSSNFDRTEIKQLAFQYQSAQLNLKKSKQYHLPTVSFVANYSTQYQAENFNYAQNIWSPFNYVGLKFNLPISGNLKNTNEINENQLKMKQKELEMAQKEQEFTNEIEKSDLELKNAATSISLNTNNLNLSRKLYQTQLKMYEIGTAYYTNILDKEASLRTAENNYVQSVYRFLVAQINYEKAMGRL